jgi:hypothetical protein
MGPAMAEIDKRESYREKAVTAEHLAAIERDPDLRHSLLRIADSYWLLADTRDMPSQDGKPDSK